MFPFRQLMYILENDRRKTLAPGNHWPVSVPTTMSRRPRFWADREMQIPLVGADASVKHDHWAAPGKMFLT